MKGRSVLLKRFIAVALLAPMTLLPLSVFTPKVEAAYTSITDPIYPEIGWMDVKVVAWDFNPKELLLYAQHQTNIPNKPNHRFWAFFYLNTDQNPATGDPSDGSEYRVYFSYLSDGTCNSELYRYDSVSGWVWVKSLGKPAGSPGGDTVELGVPLSDIGSPTAINIYCVCGGEIDDYIQKKYSYNTASEERSITVDGNPSDWAGDTPDVTDPSGDAAPSFADATTFYTTDGAGKLYMRMDLAATPPSLHPEEASKLEHQVCIYFDTDQSPSTGESHGGIGADYVFYPSVDAYHASRYVGGSLAKWSGTGWTWGVPATVKTALGTCLESSLLLSDLGISGSTIDIYIEYLKVENDDRVPNSGTFTATKATPPSRVLSEASTQILSASASSVYFIYANPSRMVSAAGPWQAAFAAYDATAAGFIYGLCANSQVICYDSNGTIVVAKEPPSDPPFNYGKVLPSSKRVVVVGGPTPNWVVDYYERTGQTPLKLYRGATDLGFQTQAGTVVASISKTTDWAHNDMFVVMAFQDSNNNFVLIIYGMNWKGTFAGGIYFKEVISKSLASYAGSALRLQVE